ncbi:MAG: YgeY family selenium metabolism-linked hydrolase [Sphaerochaetaceae bacterium]
MQNRDKELLIDLCTKMIQTPSMSGREKDLVNLLKREMVSLGFDSVNVDCMGNIVGKIEGKKGGKTVLMDGHLDTVPIANRSSWSVEPFGGEIKEGKIYGRGASDMKGALAAMIYAASLLKKEGSLKGDLYVSGTVYEELAEGYSLEPVLEATNPNIVIIGEATNLNLNVGQRGRAQIVLNTYGVPAHSANPHKGVNAVLQMMVLLEEINKIASPLCPYLGRGELVLTDIISSPYPGASVIPEVCKVTFDRRLLTGETKKSVLKPFLQLIDRLTNENSYFKADVKIDTIPINTYAKHKGIHESFVPAWLLDRSSELVRNSLDALKRIGLTDSEIGTYSFCTNGSRSAGIRNIPTLGFGPSLEHQAHVVDEYIEIDQLTKACSGYMALAKVLTA